MNRNMRKGLLAVLLIVFTFALSGCAVQDFINSILGEKGIINTSGQETSQKESESVTLSPITGLPVDAADLERRPLAVMINNALPARPQSGLDKADLVYEMLAEGGITRFMAIYLQNDVDEIGPVRSARPYYITKALEFDALYVHCGGSGDALEYINQLQVADLDEYRIGKKAFWRSSDRVAPHNLYSSTAKLRTYANEKGMEGKVNVPSFQFLKAGEKNQDGQAANSILIPYFGKSHKVSYQYDSATNTYLRFNAQTPHTDKISGEQLKGSNVLVQFADTITRDDLRLEIDLTGQGQALLFNNGEVYKGTWQKNSLREQTVFISSQGQEFKLVPGQTWIQVVPSNLNVQY